MIDILVRKIDENYHEVIVTIDNISHDLGFLSKIQCEYLGSALEDVAFELINIGDE